MTNIKYFIRCRPDQVNLIRHTVIFIREENYPLSGAEVLATTTYFVTMSQ